MTNEKDPREFFKQDELSEIDRLAAQDNSNLAQYAFNRLQRIDKLYMLQVIRNQEENEQQEKRIKKYSAVALPATGVMVTGVYLDNDLLTVSGLLVSAINAVAHSRWLLRDAVGMDSVPYRGAEQRHSYLQSIIDKHPGRPKE